METNEKKWYDNFEEISRWSPFFGHQLSKRQTKMVQEIYPEILDNFEVVVDDFEIYVRMKLGKHDFRYFGNLVCYKFGDFTDFLSYLKNRSVDIISEEKELKEIFLYLYPQYS